MSSGAGVHHLHPRGSGATAVAAQRVLEDLDGLVERLGDAYLAVPEYAALGSRYLREEVLVVSRQIVEGFFVPLAGEREPEPGVLAVLREMGRRRLEMGVPLEPMLHVYRICGGVVWRAITEAVDQGEEAVLGDLGAAWISYIDEAASIAAAAYLAASNEQVRAVDARRQALIEGLLSAETPAEVAAVSLRFSVTLASEYAPVVIAGDEVSAGIDRVLEAAPEETLGGLRGGRLLLLLPGESRDLWALWRIAGRPHVTWGPAAPPGPELLARVGEAEALLETVLASGATSGVYGPDDLIVERLLAADRGLTDVLRRRVLDELVSADHEGTLRSTLTTYLETGAVPETARREYVHGNTVLYRLRKVKELTGLDPRIPVEAAQLVLALRIDGGSP